jgi:DNA polymerase I-like protein with 3'-5' exonuclease and polymerase domains
MDIVTIDTETYYDKDYSLSKMTTEEYIRDERFEVIGVAIKVNDQEVDWYSGADPGGFLHALDYSDKAILCHNTAFDGAILSWHYGIKPKFWFDTLSMARPLHSMTVGGSLKALATYYKLGDKGDEVLRTMGLRRRDFTPEQMEAFAEYCVQDVNLTYQLFKKMARQFPKEELLVIDQTIRMYTEPKLVLDPVVLDAHLISIHERKEKLLAKLGGEAKAKKFLMSNNKFADLLRAFGVEPPMKTSPTTGKQTYAFAKNDTQFTALLEHPKPAVRTVVEARLGTKSTIEETRTERFLQIAERGSLPIMLNYYGAHTGRFSGGDKVNLQNLPSGGQLRKALAAPDGHVVVACDSSQIEARLVAYLAGQEDLVQSFREGRDVYSEFATDVYGRPVSKSDKVERHVGKTCVAEGTLVLSDSGWKPIEAVTTNDRVWDGEEWVCHAGLAYNGMKQTLPLCGAWLTPDHLVWSGTHWREAGSLVHDVSTLSQALDTAAENLPSQATFAVSGAGSAPSLSGVTVATTSTPSIRTTSKYFGQHVVQYVQRLRQTVSGIGRTLRNYLMMTTVLACSTGYRLLSVGATTSQTALTSTTAGGVFSSTRRGGTTGVCSFVTYRPLKGGMTLHGNSTEWIITPGMSRETYGSQLVPRTRQTSGGSLNLRPVYDILNSGSRNRFTILTDAGPIIVHNCILGLGYGMGAAKFQHSLATGFISVKVESHEAQKIVTLYRNKYHRIQSFWNRCNNALNGLVAGESGDMCDLIGYDAEGVILPNGLRIRYPALRRSANGFEYINDPRTYRKFIKARVMGDETPELAWTKLYGGKVVENITQAVARIVVSEQMVKIGRRYPVALQVHDEIVCVVPEEQADACKEYMMAVMSTPPKWAPDLPVACEADVGPNYGEAK